MAITTELLKTACYFRNLEEKDLEQIQTFLFERTLPVGEHIFWEDSHSETLYFVVTGLVRLFSTSAEGREFVVRMVYGGDSINDEPLFDRDTTLLSASTQSPTVLYGLHYRDCREILKLYPAVEAVINEVFATRQRYLVKLSTELVFKKVTRRLARLLLEQQELDRIHPESARITQQELASRVGTVREIITRSLRDMESMGAIQLVNHRLIIRDANKLRELNGT